MMAEELTYLEGHDNAILGYGNQYPYDERVIYSKKRIIENFMDLGFSQEQALELFGSSIAKMDLGDSTPIICDDLKAAPDRLVGDFTDSDDSDIGY